MEHLGWNNAVRQDGLGTGKWLCRKGSGSGSGQELKHESVLHPCSAENNQHPKSFWQGCHQYSTVVRPL